MPRGDILREIATGEPNRPLQIDRDRGVIFGCKILGERSRNTGPNANTYPRPTRERAAVLMQDARCFVDHGPKDKPGVERSYRDALGVHKNVREEGDGLYSDLYFNTQHPLASQLIFDATHCPDRLGFSIAAQCGSDHFEDGRRVVEEIVFDGKRHSVDLVSASATTSGIWENYAPDGQRVSQRMRISEYMRRLSPRLGRFERAILREAAESGVLSPDKDCDMGRGPEDDDPATALARGFEASILAVVRDDSMEVGEKAAKIKQLLVAHDKLKDDGDPDTDTSSDVTGAGNVPFGKKGKGPRGRDGGMSDDDVQESLLHRSGDKLSMRQLFEARRDAVPGSGNRSLREAATGSGSGNAAADRDQAQRERIAFLRGNGRSGSAPGR